MSRMSSPWSEAGKLIAAGGLLGRSRWTAVAERSSVGRGRWEEGRAETGRSEAEGGAEEEFREEGR